MEYHSQTSLSMLHRLRANDPCEWEKFVRLYSPLVFEWCRRTGINRDDAADVVQEVFSAVATSITEFRREKSADSFHGWLWGITRFKALDHFRRRAKLVRGKGGSSARVLIGQIPDSIPNSWDGSNQDADKKSVYLRILNLIKTDFQTHTWQAFWKTTVEESSAAEVAADLGISVGAVYNARYKVLRRVRDEFEGVLDFEV